MANYRWRSMTEELNDGVTDGRYKREIPNTSQEAVPGNRAATLRSRAGLNRLNGFDWSQGPETRGDGTSAHDGDR